MPNDSDYDLIIELFSKYRQMMFKIAFGILHNKSDAEDAVQDSFLWIINNLSRFSHMTGHEMNNYFASIAENRSIDIYRKRNNHHTENLGIQLDLRANETVEDTALSNLTVEEIKNAMNELSNRDYEILYMYLFKQMPPKEIGEAMGICENNIRSYIMRARKKFANILHKKGGIEHDV